MNRTTLTAMIVILSLAGCTSRTPQPTEAQQTPKQPKPGGDSSPKPSPPKAVLPPPDVTITSEKLSEEAFEDRAAYIAKYKGKVIQVTGIAVEVGPYRGYGSEGDVSLEVASNSVRTVRCRTIDKEPWKMVLPGQVVTIRGNVDQELALGAGLVQCQIVEATGTKPGVVTADELAKVAPAEPTARSEQLKKMGVKQIKLVFGTANYLIVAGEVDAFKENTSEGVAVNLKSPKSNFIKIYCIFNEKDKYMYDSLKPGQKVEVLGKLQFDENNTVRMQESILLKANP